jgi:hypothetical protein
LRCRGQWWALHEGRSLDSRQATEFLEGPLLIPRDSFLVDVAFPSEIDTEGGGRVGLKSFFLGLELQKTPDE